MTKTETAKEFARLQALFEAGKGDDFTAEEHLFYRDQVLEQWESAKQSLEAAKIAEMDLRKTFVKFAFNTETLTGTERIDLANGYQAKAVKKLNYNVDQEKVNDALDKIENMDAEGKFIAERLIKWKADLSITEYKALPDKYKAIIDTVVTTSEGAPALEIIAPKDKKVR